MTDFQKELDAYRNRLSVDHYDITVRELVRMVVDAELHITPEYQRKFRWTEEQESRLIESLFLELPVPPVFVAANMDGTWELVDGLQRVSTLVHFVEEGAGNLAIVGKETPLRLTKMERLTEWSECTFAELPKALQLYFLKRMLRVTVLSDKSDLTIRYDLFERLNTGGVALTPQEVRACIYRGDFALFLDKLSKDPNFNNLVKLQESRENDGTKEELVLKLFAYLNDRASFRDNIKAFLDNYMDTHGPNLDRADGEKLFRDVFAQLAEIVGGPLLRTGVHTTPISELEGVMVAAAELIRDGKRLAKPTDGWLDDKDLVFNSTNGTNSKKKLNGRIERAKVLLTKALETQ